MKKWLFDPFIYIAGARSLLIGMGIMLLTALVAYFSHARFDGALDMHTLGAAPMGLLLLEQLADWGCVALLLYAGGLVFSRSAIRFIDVAGTIALARWPMLLAACTTFGTSLPHTDSVKVLAASITPLFIVLAIINLLLAIWMIALMFNAFRLSCNIKGQKATIVFIAGLLLAEVTSHIILHTIYTYF